MTPLKTASMKKRVYAFLIACAGLLSACALFLGAVSVWVGLGHRDHQGSWAPLLAGAAWIAFTLWAFLRILHVLTRAMKHHDILKP